MLLELKKRGGLLLLFAVVSAPAFAAEYRYVSYGAPDFYDGGRESFSLNSSTKELVSADAIDTITVCEDKSDFYCFASLAVSFYVPTDGIEVGQHWAGNEIVFRALRNEQLEILGTWHAAWVIEADRSDRTDYFYYSECDGLLAVKHVSKKELPTQFFLVSGRTGFPK